MTITDYDLEDCHRQLVEFLDMALTMDSIPPDMCLDAWASWATIDAAATNTMELQQAEIEKLRADNQKLATALMPVFNTHGGTA